MHSLSFKFVNIEQMDSAKKEFESTFRVVFLHSKNPHLNSVDLVRVPFLTGITVCLPTGGALCLKLCFVYISDCSDGP